MSCVRKLARHKFAVEFVHVRNGLIVRWWPPDTFNAERQQPDKGFREMRVGDHEMNDKTLRGLIVRWKMEGLLDVPKV